MTNDLFQENISVPADKTPAPSDVLQQELLTVKEALQKAEKSRDSRTSYDIESFENSGAFDDFGGR